MTATSHQGTTSRSSRPSRVAKTYSLSAAGSMRRPSLLVWFQARAIFPSSQSVNPATISSSTAQPSALGPRISQRNSGTPSRRRKLSRFGTVQIRSSAGDTLTEPTLLRGDPGAFDDLVCAERFSRPHDSRPTSRDTRQARDRALGPTRPAPGRADPSTAGASGSVIPPPGEVCFGRSTAEGVRFSRSTAGRRLLRPFHPRETSASTVPPQRASGSAGGGQETADQGGVLDAGSDLHSAGDVDAPGAGRLDRFGHVRGVEAAGLLQPAGLAVAY